MLFSPVRRLAVVWSLRPAFPFCFAVLASSHGTSCYFFVAVFLCCFFAVFMCEFCYTYFSAVLFTSGVWRRACSVCHASLTVRPHPVRYRKSLSAIPVACPMSTISYLPCHHFPLLRSIFNFNSSSRLPASAVDEQVDGVLPSGATGLPDLAAIE